VLAETHRFPSLRRNRFMQNKSDKMMEV